MASCDAHHRSPICIESPELELDLATAASRGYRRGMSEVGADDPVSWLLIRQGWKVVSSDGAEVGNVDEVVGDDEHDIFDGLAVATSAFGKPRYVPSEQVGEITEGVVRLKVVQADAARLGETIGADVRDVEAKVLAPTQRHEHSMNVWRRITFWLERTLRRS